MCLGWSDAASSSMYDEQTINSIEDFRSLDDESVKTCCKVLRRHGGATATGDTDTGVKVKARAESNMMIAVYFIKHRGRVFSDVTFRNVTLAGVSKLSCQREM